MTTEASTDILHWTTSDDARCPLIVIVEVQPFRLSRTYYRAHYLVEGSQTRLAKDLWGWTLSLPTHEEPYFLRDKALTGNIDCLVREHHLLGTMLDRFGLAG